MQGLNNTVCDFDNSCLGFTEKIGRFSRLISEGEIVHFPKPLGEKANPGRERYDLTCCFHAEADEQL